MKTFMILWFGQFVSRIGTALTRFALMIWAYERMGSATTIALLGFSSFLPFVLISPLAGVWVDRLDRRRVLRLADLGAGVMTLSMLLLYTRGDLQIWHLYLAQALSGAFEAFQAPAYTAATTVILPREHFARASGLRSMADSGAQVIAPFLAGILLAWLGIGGVMLIDVGTFLVALATLAYVHIPTITQEPAPAKPATKARTQFWEELGVGFRYIGERPGLLGLTLIFTGINLIAALTYYSILPAMVLARSGSHKLALAAVQGALGAGGVVGGLVIGIWGGPRRKIHGSLAFAALSFIVGDLFLALGRDVPVWAIAAFLGALCEPIVVGSNNAIWQSKVAPHVQGRVFAVYGMARQSMMPVGYLLAGILADQWLEPAMLPGGPMASLFGPLVGTGPGTGMALMFLCTAVLGVAMSLSGYLLPAVRCAEQDLPAVV